MKEAGLGSLEFYLAVVLHVLQICYDSCFAVLTNMGMANSTSRILHGICVTCARDLLLLSLYRGYENGYGELEARLVPV